ncbi:hypothetical protein A2962_03555 [Candidatus Woesebacteria bacterium RIFCSPLOWO2_01_FULL_39_61]|uniref:ATP synthase F1 complex delta/epsilon subunit N-terminal domain-containing protein n=1 Tax=Candidatus Woesebacteria bacterium RIFCSPHIGHO2_02_FULL_39_13 TaxID=1802505 RepID=A0A1F7Z3P4_9BACT|nr:MAG: hypothetical protein A2692_00685 [Candidatus Woesebacteria bacterium RIFCSPHIGHO2_01_FULL_39_95]OGM34127.1 MAG: hypothetical protein A3D01_00140 [Candidatus Woesebacteria bacterium RIFCSPHIGHO2_02_FULL_39_13]OGM38726.1 MAG: hypothetical protein A3E13_03875 [Candidatus Woesebacteria bacterium RIFCSPHIGHO2_12_FULL_40_20]OGM67587.1 MAG: hypothetical protein A2962_03555 [Candidatus Woesebacteria bacterium RIFCSPLOWO2_01_FULL_39_61]OGM75432.1 MAG: hypothetical protein A3H19_03595 [Candidatus
MNDKVFHLLVRAREGIIFEGDVDSVTSFNEDGKFDVLAQHANFISLIQKSLTIIEHDGKVTEIPVDNALLRTRENKVEVYLGIQGIKPSEFKSADEMKIGGKNY